MACTPWLHPRAARDSKASRPPGARACGGSTDTRHALPCSHRTIAKNTRSPPPGHATGLGENPRDRTRERQEGRAPKGQRETENRNERGLCGKVEGRLGVRRLSSLPRVATYPHRCGHRTVAKTHGHRRRTTDPLRRVRYFDAETNKRLKFLTNNFLLPALTNAEIYRSRWQVELFFRWIKLHFANSEVLRHRRERREDLDLDRRLRLCASRDRAQEVRAGGESVPNPTDSQRHSF